MAYTRFVLVVALVACLAALASSSPFDDLERPSSELFEAYLVRFSVSYASEAEKQAKFVIFEDNLNYIKALNAEAAQSGLSTRFSVGKFMLHSRADFSSMVRPRPSILSNHQNINY